MPKIKIHCRLILFTIFLFQLPILYQPLQGQEIQQRKIRTSHRSSVEIYKLEKGQKKYGHVIWFDRSAEHIRSGYIAHCRDRAGLDTSVFSRYEKWVAGRSQILTCSGGFTNSFHTEGGNALPIGLTIDLGYIINRNLEGAMDALVILDNSRSIAIINLQDRSFQIANQHFDLAYGKTDFLRWAAENEITAFQTQLLAHNNTLQIDRSGRIKKRERRILVVGRAINKKIYHIIFDLPGNQYLFDAARDVFYFLVEKQRFNIHGMVNIDTGNQNILEVYQENGHQDHRIKGDANIRNAANLLTFYSLYD